MTEGLSDGFPAKQTACYLRLPTTVSITRTLTEHAEGFFLVEVTEPCMKSGMCAGKHSDGEEAIL